MSNLDLARVEFAFVTINHFFFVPITIGLAFLTALLQEAWHRSRRDGYVGLTPFFGILLAINLASGEGHRAGVPVRDELGRLLAAGRQHLRRAAGDGGAGRVLPGVDVPGAVAVRLGQAAEAAAPADNLGGLARLRAVGGVHHGGQLLDAAPGRLHHGQREAPAQRHPGAVIMLAVSAWQLRHRGDREVFTRSARLALIVLVPAILFTMLVGDELGVIEARYQPMKIAAAEAQWTTCQPCSFSLFQIGGGNKDETPAKIIAIPHLLSLLATNHWNGKVTGLNPLQAQYSKSYGSGYYVPNVFIQYWAMRVMAYAGVLVFLLSLWGLWLIRRKKLAASRRFLWVSIWATVLPFLMNTAGWLLTESGRQPWIVQGIMLTKNGISPTVSSTWIVISLVAFVLLYGTLGTVDLILMLKYSREQLPPPRAGADIDAPVPAIQY